MVHTNHLVSANYLVLEFLVRQGSQNAPFLTNSETLKRLSNTTRTFCCPPNSEVPVEEVAVLPKPPNPPVLVLVAPNGLLPPNKPPLLVDVLLLVPNKLDVAPPPNAGCNGKMSRYLLVYRGAASFHICCMVS